MHSSDGVAESDQGPCCKTDVVIMAQVSGTFKVVFPFRLWKVSNLYNLMIFNLVENNQLGQT